LPDAVPDPGTPSASPWAVLMALWTRRQELGHHLMRYAELLQQWQHPSRAALGRQAGLLVLAGVGLLVAVMLAGVSVLLWVTVLRPQPAGDAVATALLLAVPGAPALLALWAVQAARRAPPLPLLVAWTAQWQADLALLRAARAEHASSAQRPPSPVKLMAAGACDGTHAALRPIARDHPWALVGGAALAGALLIGGRPWRSLLRPSLLASLGARWAMNAWLESRMPQHTRPHTSHTSQHPPQHALQPMPPPPAQLHPEPVAGAPSSPHTPASPPAPPNR
jgi:hypothetical protein